jgi:hypothetical protein
MEDERYVKQVSKFKPEMEKVLKEICLGINRLVWKPAQVKRSNL